MTVYVVIWHEYEAFMMIGVYSTEEKAKESIEECYKRDEETYASNDGTYDIYDMEVK